PARTTVRFDWDTPLPRYWNWPGFRSGFEAAQYIFPSDSERQFFLRRHPGMLSQQAIVLPNAVDLELFRPASGQAGPTDGLRVGFAGQWTPAKGILELLAAWREVKASVPAAELYLAGGSALWKNTSAIRQADEVAAPLRAMEEEK